MTQGVVCGLDRGHAASRAHVIGFDLFDGGVRPEDRLSYPVKSQTCVKSKWMDAKEPQHRERRGNNIESPQNRLTTKRSGKQREKQTDVQIRSEH